MNETIHFPDGPVRISREDAIAREPQPLGYYVPKVVKIEPHLNRHYSAEQIAQFEGEVAWSFSLFGDSPAVTDKHGVVHKPIPMGRWVNRKNVDPIFTKLGRISTAGCQCGVKTPFLKYHAEDCRYRLAEEAADLVQGLLERSSSTKPEPEQPKAEITKTKGLVGAVGSIDWDDADVVQKEAGNSVIISVAALEALLQGYYTGADQPKSLNERLKEVLRSC